MLTPWPFALRSTDVRYSDWLCCSVAGVVASRHPNDARSLFVSVSPEGTRGVPARPSRTPLCSSAAVAWYPDLHARFYVRVPWSFPKHPPIVHCVTPVRACLRCRAHALQLFHPNVGSRG